MAVEPSGPPATPGWTWRSLSLSHVQGIVGIVAGVLSILGALYSAVQFMKPVPNGELRTIVQAAGSAERLPDSKIEILTADSALVATVTPDARGEIHQRLNEGVYLVRVTHPNYAGQTQKVKVSAGQTVTVTASLRAGSGPSAEHAGQVIDGGVRAVRRMFGR